MHQTNSYKSPI